MRNIIKIKYRIKIIVENKVYRKYHHNILYYSINSWNKQIFHEQINKIHFGIIKLLQYHLGEILSYRRDLNYYRTKNSVKIRRLDQESNSSLAIDEQLFYHLNYPGPDNKHYYRWTYFYLTSYFWKVGGVAVCTFEEKMWHSGTVSSFFFIYSMVTIQI